MKQHITKKQLNELNEKQAKKLRDYLTNHSPNLIPGDFMWKDRWLLTKLNIGQMIEFLDEKWLEILGDWSGSDCDYFPDNKELCDALWEAVKEVLKK